MAADFLDQLPIKSAKRLHDTASITIEISHGAEISSSLIDIGAG